MDGVKTSQCDQTLDEFFNKKNSYSMYGQFTWVSKSQVPLTEANPNMETTFHAQETIKILFLFSKVRS